jgi:hypothetical protein
MAKAKAKKNNKKSRSRPRVRMVPRGNLLDGPALAYAELLADPCGGALVHPVYAGADSGFLYRAESFVTFGGSSTLTSGVMHWTPGYVNASNTELIWTGTATSGGTNTVTPSTDGPGRAFLASNAKGVRCVAACVKITFPGAENARAGRVHYGLTQAGIMDNGATVSPDSIAQCLQHYGRTPSDTVEVIWRPGTADMEFNDPTELPSAPIRDRKSAITVAWAGLPAAVGLTFHFTAVYEWTPAVGLGIGHNALGKARSKNTLDDVVDYLLNKGERFVLGMAYYTGAGAAMGVVDLVRGAFGSMPANRNTRSLRYFAT